MKIIKFTKGQSIITYGEEGKEYYILSKGKVRVIVYKPGTDTKDPDLASKILFTKEMEQGSGFGELALIYNDKRSATIEATEDCETYMLDGTIFKKIVIHSTMSKRTSHAGFLNKIQLFEGLE